ncbi:MAG: hypothetical protein QNJ18_04625 [Xenococcaceae cyanobacterium MO_167.B52]|nr:hypothetical protein [Xenococcaceae cyanobacterium MO_167.B52]
MTNYFIHKSAFVDQGSEDNRLIRKLLRGLRRVCHLGQTADHKKLQALGKEIKIQYSD